jgi:hypothetical protein
VAALGAAACLVPIWSAGYLPMVDLPQHAAQIALWVHRDDPLFFPEGIYRFNWFTPYLGAYLLARLFALASSVPVAMKLTVSVAAVGVPLSTLALLRATRGDAWWALAAAPLAFGVSFYSGFLNFLLAIPLAILLVAAALRDAESPTARGGAWVVSCGFALALCHALAFAVGAAVAVAGVWGGAAARRTKIRGALLVLAPLPVVAAWAVSVWLRDTHVRTPMHWEGLPTRIFRAPAALVGSPEAALGWAVLALLAAALLALGVRGRIHRGLLAALGAGAVFYLAAPDSAFHTVVLPERFPAILAVSGLALLRMPESTRARRAVVALLAVVSFAWSAHLAFRFRAFDREMSGFEEVLSRTEPGRILRMIPVDARSRAVPGYPLYWNVGAWYQVEKGGHVGFSFSQLFPVLIRYRETPDWAEPIWAKRGEVDWREADREVDYFLFRSETGDPERSFPEGPDRPRLLARRGPWRLYGRLPRLGHGGG